MREKSALEQGIITRVPLSLHNSATREQMVAEVVVPTEATARNRPKLFLRLDHGSSPDIQVHRSHRTHA